MPRAALLGLALAGLLGGCASSDIAPSASESVDPLFGDGPERWTVRISGPADDLSSCWDEEPLAEARTVEADGASYLDVVLTPPAGQAEADGIRDCVAAQADSTVVVLAPAQ